MTPHQDGTFLNNDPLKLVGLWFPLDDATLENGCLWFVPGSHRRPVTRRFVRNPRRGGGGGRTRDEREAAAPNLIFEGEDAAFAEDEWVAAPVKKGEEVSRGPNRFPGRSRVYSLLFRVTLSSCSAR